MTTYRVCRVPDCPTLTMTSMCALHRREQDALRGTSTERGYGGNWRIIRAQFLNANPWCIDCGNPAEHVDHYVSLAQGGTNDVTNLRPLCHSCHSRKTVERDGALSRG